MKYARNISDIKGELPALAGGGGSQSLMQQLTAHRSTVTQMSSLIVKSSMEMQTADKCKECLNMCIEKLD